MDPATSSALLNQVLGLVREGVVATVRRLTRPDERPDGDLSVRLEHGLSRHLNHIAGMASELHLFGMSTPRDTAEVTLPLGLRDLPRRFMTGGSATTVLTEADVLASQHHVMILGDPGAGKTTTLKRLALNALLEQSRTDDIWAFPVMVTCRDHDWGRHSLGDVLADVLGIPPADQLPPTLRATIDRAEAACSVLDEGPAVLLIDGVDEVPYRHRRRLLRDLEAFGRRPSLVRTILTCRSGDFDHLAGYRILELLPLDDDQIRQMSHRWLGDTAPAFLDALADSAIADLASRPLFLAQLMIVFANGGGSLPDQPTNLYRRIIRLLLQDWDEQRRIARPSAYARFQVDEKMEFLSALSYQLTVSLKAIRFTNHDLVQAYTAIAPQFGLPIKDASRVARELEAHTGIIVETGDAFEFSHLSLQEYLCAYYIVREPFSESVARYLEEYPAPVAIAVALSSNPSAWLTGVVKRAGALQSAALTQGFVHRMGKERPRFAASDELGHSLVKLMAKAGADSAPAFQTLAANEEVVASLRLVRSCYRWSAARSGDLAVAAETDTPGCLVRRGEIDRELAALMLPDLAADLLSKPVPPARPAQRV